MNVPSTMPVMNVVFIEPFFPSNQRQFARALAEAGATVLGIGAVSYTHLTLPTILLV